jgi:transcription initiation factor TFIIF subunit alpha
MIQDGPAIQPQDQKQAIAAGLVKTEPGAATTAVAGGTTSPPPQPDSRAGSPAAPNLGGHSMVAKRATSPKAPRPKPQTAGATGGGSRATSPLAGGGGGSRATSPAGSSRAGSPAAPGLQAKGQQQLSQNKRKAEELGVPKKKRKPAPGGADGVLDANAILAYLRSTPNPTTRMCIQHFTPYLKEAEAKAAFSKLVKEVAVLKDGFLIIRPQFENAGSP